MRAGRLIFVHLVAAIDTFLRTEFFPAEMIRAEKNRPRASHCQDDREIHSTPPFRMPEYCIGIGKVLLYLRCVKVITALPFGKHFHKKAQILHRQNSQ
jgi:hypothetical protein